MSELVPREVCFDCRRPKQVCYCHLVVKLSTKTRVVILQHPRERDVPVNTARIASLCLPDSELAVGVEWSGSSTLRRALSDPERPAALLYPGPDAVDVERHPPAGPISLIVVDGTWWQARKLVRANPELAALPRYAFQPRAPSQYRIRAEPQDDYVSTIEALVHVLGVLEGDRDRFAPMLEPFRAMVEHQIAFAASGGGRKHVKKPRAKSDTRSRSPKFLRERFADLVCVHGEANAWPYGTPERTERGDELVQWTARRVATGETFERFVTPANALAPNTFRHLEIGPAEIARAVDRGALAVAWQAFLRPTDVVCSWGTYATRLFEHAGGSLGGARIDLRDSARVHAGGRVGTMAAFLDRVGGSAITMESSAASGRGAGRLAQLVAIAEALARPL